MAFLQEIGDGVGIRLVFDSDPEKSGILIGLYFTPPQGGIIAHCANGWSRGEFETDEEAIRFIESV